MPTRKQIRERAAKNLGLFVALGSASNNVSNTVAYFGTITDLSPDNERFKWSFLYNETDDEWRLVNAVVASSGQVTVARAFTNTISTAKTCSLYGILSPTEWNDLLNEQVLPDLFYPDRVVIPLTAGTAEYNVTATAAWITDVGQILRMRYRNVDNALVPWEDEASIVYPQQASDGVVTIHIPNAVFPTNCNVLIEARHYYGALNSDSNSIGAHEKLVEVSLKHEGLKQVFQALGMGAKRIFGQAMVLAERERQEQEQKWIPKMPYRDWWSEDDPVVGEPGTGIVYAPWGP